MKPTTLDRQAGPGLPLGGYAQPDHRKPQDGEAHVVPIADRGGTHLVPDWADYLQADRRGWHARSGATCACNPSVRVSRDGDQLTRVHIHHAFDGRNTGGEH